MKGKILIDRSFEKLPGFCVGLHLLNCQCSKREKRVLAQREIFGPVIHLIEFTSLIEAVEIFNGTEYALTGGVFSQSQDDIDFLLKFLRAGNLYVNRPNTGARAPLSHLEALNSQELVPKREVLITFHNSISL